MKALFIEMILKVRSPFLVTFFVERKPDLRRLIKTNRRAGLSLTAGTAGGVGHLRSTEWRTIVRDAKGIFTVFHRAGA
jgi:hypothetical protein